MQELTPKNNFILYTSENGDIKFEVYIKNENIWLTQKLIAQLFDCSVDNVSLHLKNIFETHELQENSVIEEFSITATDGKNYNTKHYNLDAIISVGYRVNSSRATQFRIWATQTLREYILKGFVINDERLKQGEQIFGKDYFKELLEKVRSIRASERRIWLQITDIFSECSTDYVRGSEIAQEFFATVQNKFHYAITGNTAAEIISVAADSNKEHMGLTTWKKSPEGRILKSDVTVAKNYLQESDIKKLERTVSSFFDYIENQIENQKAFNMSDFIESVNKFLSFNDFKVLEGKGNISKEVADAKAESEYDIYNKTQKIASDFEKEMKKILNQK